MPFLGDLVNKAVLSHSDGFPSNLRDLVASNLRMGLKNSSN